MTAEVNRAAGVAVNQIKSSVEQAIVKVAKDIQVQNQIQTQVAIQRQREIAQTALEASNGAGLYLTAACGCVILCMIIYVACMLRGMKGKLDMDYEDQGVEQILHIKNPMKPKVPKGDVPHMQMDNSLAPPARGGGYASGTDVSMVDMDI